MTIAHHSRPAEWAPFPIEPEFVGRVWGYRDLRPWFDRVEEHDPIGEVWLTGDACVVAAGAHRGQTLGALFRSNPAEMLGEEAPSQDSPLLIKLIFAREKLSVQVHPDDLLAAKYGQPRGKTECWYALQAEPGAQVAVGLKPGVSLDQIKDGIHSGTLEQCLNVLSVSRGDMILVDAGTVHAIWPGSILLETQQNSDITYRLYDYGRPRELHIEKGLEAVKLETVAGKIAPLTQAGRTVLVETDYFLVERLAVDGSLALNRLVGDASPGDADPAEGLAYYFAAAGAGRISGPAFEPLDFPARSVVCAPAAAPEFDIEDLGGLDLIRVSPRWPGRTFTQ
jgi:mannose-6-phosphate isomerase